MLWYPKGEKQHSGKFKCRWFGPYRVQYRLPNNTALLVTEAHFEPNPIVVNINKLKPYRFYSEDQLITIGPKQVPRGLSTTSEEHQTETAVGADIPSSVEDVASTLLATHSCPQSSGAMAHSVEHPALRMPSAPAPPEACSPPTPSVLTIGCFSVEPCRASTVIKTEPSESPLLQASPSVPPPTVLSPAPIELFPSPSGDYVQQPSGSPRNPTPPPFAPLHIDPIHSGSCRASSGFGLSLDSVSVRVSPSSTTCGIIPAGCFATPSPRAAPSALPSHYQSPPSPPC